MFGPAFACMSEWATNIQIILHIRLYLLYRALSMPSERNYIAETQMPPWKQHRKTPVFHPYHAQDAFAGVAQVEVLIREAVAIDGSTAGAIVVREVAALVHEPGNDAAQHTHTNVKV